jgi:hypothetical protein
MRGSKNLRLAQAGLLQILEFMGWSGTLNTMRGLVSKGLWRVILGSQVQDLPNISPLINSLPSLPLSGAVTGTCCRKLKLQKRLLKQALAGLVPLQTYPLSVSGRNKSLLENRTVRTHPEGSQVQVELQVVSPEELARSQVRTT